MPTLTTRDAAIDYELTGAGPSLVLVHGSWLCRAQWSEVESRFARRFRTVTYSPRGHGDSRGNGPLDDDVADLAAVIADLDLGPAHLVPGTGHAEFVTHEDDGLLPDSAESAMAENCTASLS